MWRTLRWLVIAVAVVGGLWLLVVKPLERTLAGTRSTVETSLDRVLAAITQTDTRVVEGRAEIVESTEVSELALLELRMSATRTIEKSESFSVLPLGTKKLIVRGYYQVKGGYRLKPGTSLRIEDGQPVARFPKPQVLSVELVDFDVLSDVRQIVVGETDSRAAAGG